VKDVNSASAADLFGIDGFVLATTQTFQSVAGATKKFLEKLWINKDRIAKGELFASMICYKNDPSATQTSLKNIAGYLGFTDAISGVNINLDEFEAGQIKARQLGLSLAKVL
jgi:hypothetical protein